MAAETVIVERHGPVLRVRMNRPDKLNAQNPTLITELDTAFAAGAADADVHRVEADGLGRAGEVGQLPSGGHSGRVCPDGDAELDGAHSLTLPGRRP